MSQSGVRASQREIRKALGPEVVALLAEHEEAIKAHTEQIRLANLRLNVQYADQSEHSRELHSVKTTSGATFASLAEFCGRSLLGRLRWLFTGK